MDAQKPFLRGSRMCGEVQVDMQSEKGTIAESSIYTTFGTLPHVKKSGRINCYFGM